MQLQGCGNAETVIWLVVFGEVVSMYDYAFKTRRADVVIAKNNMDKMRCRRKREAKSLKRSIIARAEIGYLIKES